MACPSVSTGNEFLVQSLAHIDCQAQTIGSFGFQSLASPGSPAVIALTGLLTLFVAIYGIRLLFSPGDEPRSLVSAVLKVGIVLTLAASWPAWRVVAYDTVLYGPAEVAAAIMPSSTLPSPQADLPQRLQGIDTGIAAITFAGTGRVIEGPVGPEVAREFQSVALGDDAGYGWSRPIFLATTLGALGILRIGGGLLLAIAPLMAGLLLFDFTRGLFAGWVRGLVFVAVASLGATLLLSIQVAIMEPWLIDVISLRNVREITPRAPTEALALVLAFAIAMVGMLVLLAKVAFQNSWTVPAPILQRLPSLPIGRDVPQWRPAGAAEIPVHSRALAISESVSSSMRRERGEGGGIDPVRRIEMVQRGEPAAAAAAPGAPAVNPLGSGYRRNVRRETGSQRGRDERG
jgi:type IV secretion system protein VirB6